MNKVKSGGNVLYVLYVLLLNSRCDQTEDCEDGSDEKHCNVVFIDKSTYLKDKYPPPIGEYGRVLVNVSVVIEKILNIDQVVSKL